MGKKEEQEKARAIAEIEAKFNEPEYKGEKLFNLIGICCAGITISISITRLYFSVDTYIQKQDNPSTKELQDSLSVLSVIASWFWTFSNL